MANCGRPDLFKIHMNNKIEVKKSQLHGIGVFATEPIPQGTVVESCPVILSPPEYKKAVETSCLYPLAFVWSDNVYAFPLGYGTTYNFSGTPNVSCRTTGNTIEFVAMRDIAAGEELLMQVPDWFLAHKKPK